MQNIWNDCAINEVLCSGKEYRNIPQTIKRRKANWIGQNLHILEN
jgi:hypothetical protein